MTILNFVIYFGGADCGRYNYIGLMYDFGISLVIYGKKCVGDFFVLQIIF
jgi:hypothetical protein